MPNDDSRTRLPGESRREVVARRDLKTAWACFCLIVSLPWVVRPAPLRASDVWDEATTGSGRGIFAPAGRGPGLPPPAAGDDAPRAGSAASESPPPAERPRRYESYGNGWIPRFYVDDYPKIGALDNNNPTSFWYSLRPNLFNEQVTDEWDFYNLINTDRPDFTDAVFSAGKGVALVETGYTFRSLDDGTQHITNRTLPETLLRWGITDEFEVRMKWMGYSITEQHQYSPSVAMQSFGGTDLILGIKYEVVQQNGWLPMITIVSDNTVPTGTNGVSANQVQPSIEVLAGWGIRRWLYLKAETGAAWLRNTSSSFVARGPLPYGPFDVATTRYNQTLMHNSISLLYQASKRVGGFVEWFSFQSTGAPDNSAIHYADTGLYIYATTSVQLDIRFGKRISNRIDEVFAGGGLSVRY